MGAEGSSGGRETLGQPGTGEARRQAASPSGPEHGAAAGKDKYRAMFTSMVWRIVIVSLLPLAVIGGANFYLFYSLNRSIVIQQHSTALGHHRESVEAFLGNLRGMLSTLAHQYSLAELKAGDLERIFQVIQHQASIFTDIGIIDAAGHHVKYIGSYSLSGRNYRTTEWFRQVMEKDVFVSDVFLGFRGVPHFVIAVKRTEGQSFWILRATVNTDYFSKLVDAARIGRTGETYIVNSQGLYQTRTRSGGELLTRADYPDLARHDGTRVTEGTAGGKRYLYTTTWLTTTPWLLIYRQEMAEVYSPLRKASVVGVLMFILGAAGAMALAVVVSRGQVRLVERSDEVRETLTHKLLHTGRVAAVGEMSAGLAHEIHNPLAIIDTLRTWIEDLLEGPVLSEEDRQEIVTSAKKIGEQVERCKTITHGLLKFSRRVDARPEEVDLHGLLHELALIARTRARVENVLVEVELQPTPPVVAAPAHLQQIFMNLVNNAIDATAGRPEARVTIRSGPEGEGVRVDVVDNGAGIPLQNLSRIFIPFFTTKPVGRGTGLGLAICYGLVQDLGGTIHVESHVGTGTTFTVHLPLAHHPEVQRAEVTWQI